MPTPFDMVINNLKGMGFFEFLLPFIITAAIFYGLLRKSKIFGEPDRNVAVNAIISLGAAFLVWASPIILGIDITKDLAKFFLQGMSAMLVFSIGSMIATMFFGEDLPKQIKEKIGGSTVWGLILVAGIIVGFAILVSSGLINIFLPAGGWSSIGGPETGSMVVTIGILAVFLIVIVLIAK